MNPKGMWVSEIFKSIQGEGPLMGTPCTFLRLAYCNLHCTWCDSWYTWDHSRIDVAKDAKHMSRADVAEQLRDADTIVVTGGEPLLQQEQLALLMHAMPDHRWQFETNGTKVPIAGIVRHHPIFVVSPKMNVGDPLSRSIRREALWTMAARHRAHFKFVISKMMDISDVRSMQVEYGIPQDHIWLMPEARSVEELNERVWVAKAAVDFGYMYSDRLHIRLWGDKRGT